MLLRLLPLPTTANPNPLTILFTLPLPTHPYSSRQLPLPPALLGHKSLCLQEDIYCPNVLLGEKSSWIAGVIDDVTFSLPSSNITVNLIDGTTTVLPLTPACINQLHRVVEEVQLSFSAPAQVPASPRSSISSIASTSSASSSMSRQTSNPPTQRRTPSSLLLSLLSPLLPSPPPAESVRPSLAAPPCAPARVHRRAARSLLVDTYRRYVLPRLKEQMPSAYFPWAIASETSRQLEEFARVQAEVNHIIDNCGVSRVDLEHTVGPTRSRSASASSTSSMSDDDSDMESAASPVTPATSVFSPSACATPARKASNPSPQAFLLSIPPAHALPAQCRTAYASLLASLTSIASRIHQIKKLNARYEREEGKRTWLDGLERGRLADRAIRRAYSDGIQPINAPRFVTAEVSRRSRMWQSWSADDQARYEMSMSQYAASHPAMMDASSEDEGQEGDASLCSASDSDEEGPLTPPKPRNPNERPMISIKTPSTMEILEDFVPSPPPRRPTLHSHVTQKMVLASVVEPTPGLTASQSETDDEWEHEEDISTPTLVTPPLIARSWLASSVPSQKKVVVTQVDEEEDDEQTYYTQCGIYA
ncbi:hypothetical protein I316_04773 [Kwoniella heveanensis BCC8398]|uniref:Uncharacterized protein n=1 Tax=Kwoniella heveanensis BCC8398 TaxID=1296120 RepID=A0A1B9GRJ6_9TREE|nr:hypothetical protein I316_04773 [Kwoniella heveanensis BCC8398]